MYQEPDQMPQGKRPKTVRKNIDIDAAKLSAARRILRAPSDTATVDQALDDVIFVHQLSAAMDALVAAGPLASSRGGQRARRVAERR